MNTNRIRSLGTSRQSALRRGERALDPWVVAVVATHNEERFVQNCLKHFVDQGVDIYLIDNESSDRTIDLASEYLGKGLLEIETLPRRGTFDLSAQLKRKERIARELGADWIIHADADEVRLSPTGWPTLRQALGAVQAAGFNAVNFLEFTFVPTVAAPDHDHPDYESTMRSYYHFAPRHPWHVKAFRPSQLGDFELVSSGGHLLRATELRLCPVDFKLRHYIYLSLDHAVRKYVDRRFSKEETERNWHGWRATAEPGRFRLVLDHQLKEYSSDDELDSSDPVTRHLFYDDS